jgi:hypothetical protein
MSKDDKIIKEEIDLIDLLGVFIKRRVFIISFILIFTLIASSLVFLKEYLKTNKEKNINSSEYVLTNDEDYAFSTYMFVKRNAEKEEYKDFLKQVFYPSNINVPDFDLIINNKLTKVFYIFKDQESMNSFNYKYKNFIFNISKMKINISNMPDDAISICSQLINSRSFSSVDVSSLFNSPKDWKNCNKFNYYFSNISNLIKKATNEDISFNTYVPFLLSFSNFNDAYLKINNEDLKLNNNCSLNKTKLIKYFLMLFVLSIFLSVVIAFLLEFWENNKNRLKKYW